MKFIVEGITKCAPRLGVLKEIERHPNITLETPMAMLYTRGGSIPHITNEVFKLITTKSQIIQIPLVSTYNFEDVMTHYNGTIAEFVGMKECISCMTVQDPGDYTQPGHHVQDLIPLWTRHGKVLLNAKLYMILVELFKPDMYYFLSDGDTNIASPTKRVNKAVQNTVKYYKECIEIHKNSKILKNSFAMGVIAGGYNLKARKDCMDVVCKIDSIGGYLIDGLHNNGPEVEFLCAEEIKPVVEYIVENLHHTKLKAIHGCWNPVTILQLIKLGIDLFDTSYCHIVTERSCALTFSLDLSNTEEAFELNLRQSQFADDFRPILPGCACLTCVKYSRGYIHHLVTVQELLGPLLLTIHNVHHYTKFFETIRECIRNDTLRILEETITKQFNLYQNGVKEKRDEDEELNSTEVVRDEVNRTNEDNVQIPLVPTC
ncbi:hypothetical protein RN001_009651 [Aquatica leii]|uniref:Queuine tRNA-ribosyltransferase accessory subunit 2 n=1 Tax=Aquatica leii TaxID=1421715 RepID=A0AAN7Q2M2_9COLE|nr:hypothetical protein RN001_009651 [Aquatica leii]